MPAPDQVQVKVKDGLASIRSRIDHQPVTAFCQSCFSGKLAGCELHVTQQYLVGRSGGIEGFDMLERYDQDVDGGDRVSILKADQRIIPEKDLRGEFAIYDAAKGTLGGIHQGNRCKNHAIGEKNSRGVKSSPAMRK